MPLFTLEKHANMLSQRPLQVAADGWSSESISHPCNTSTTPPPHGGANARTRPQTNAPTSHRAPWLPPPQQPRLEASSTLLTRQHHAPCFLFSAPPTGGTRGDSLVLAPAGPRCSQRRRWSLGKRRTRSQRRRCWRPSSACRAVAVPSRRASSRQGNQPTWPETHLSTRASCAAAAVLRGRAPCVCRNVTDAAFAGGGERSADSGGTRRCA